MLAYATGSFRKVLHDQSKLIIIPLQCRNHWHDLSKLVIIPRQHSGIIAMIQASQFLCHFRYRKVLSQNKQACYHTTPAFRNHCHNQASQFLYHFRYRKVLPQNKQASHHTTPTFRNHCHNQASSFLCHFRYRKVLPHIQQAETSATSNEEKYLRICLSPSSINLTLVN